MAVLRGYDENNFRSPKSIRGYDGCFVATDIERARCGRTSSVVDCGQSRKRLFLSAESSGHFLTKRPRRTTTPGFFQKSHSSMSEFGRPIEFGKRFKQHNPPFEPHCPPSARAKTR